MTILPSFRKWFSERHGEFQALVLDVDGVLLVNHRPVAGSVALVAALRRWEFPFTLLTNDGNHSVAQKRRHLARCGFAFSEDEITSCSDGLVEIARKLNLLGKRVFVMGDLGKPNFARRAGMRFTRDRMQLDECCGIIVGEAHYDWEPTLNAAINFLVRHPERPLIVPNPDEYYPGKRREIIVAAGGVARFIQRVLAVHAVNVSPTYLGKPYQPIFEHNHRHMEARLGLKLSRDRVLMVGDSLTSDVRGALDFGYRAALLLTGITTEQNLRASSIHPDFVFRGY